MGTAVGVLIGLILGNFFYQSFSGHDWYRAFDRSFFQAIAIATYGGLRWWYSRKSNQ